MTSSRSRLVVPALTLVLLGLGALAVSYGSRGPTPATPPPAVVTLYCSLDEVYAAPILEQFGVQSGCEVQVVYDSEASKTVGLANRLLAERDHPRADVFWNSEILRTLMLKEAGVLEPYRSPAAADIPNGWKDPEGVWTGFAARARVLVFRTNEADPPPKSLEDLASPSFQGKIAMAQPFFGTTSTHVAALCQILGKERGLDLLRRIKANGVKPMTGNSAVCDAVVRGDVFAGLTDTDDVWARRLDGKPVDLIYPDEGGLGTLVIPNTVALIRNAPHPEAARRLIDYLLSKDVEQALARAGGRQIPVRDMPVPEGVRTLPQIRAMTVDWPGLPAVQKDIEADLRALFMD